MRKGLLETIVGLFVVLGFAAFCWLAFQLGEVPFLTGNKNYTLNAVFDNVSGVKKGAAVQISGVDVGEVASVVLSEGQRAELLLRIKNGVRIPADTAALVKSQGIIGDKYVQLALGKSSKELHDGDRIQETESALDIEALISSFGFGSGSFNGDKTYEIKAIFDNVSGVKQGATVQIAGVVVGDVSKVELNETDAARLVLRLDSSVKVPVDSMASVKTQGLIGGKYIELSPGGDEELLKPGAAIFDTESSVDIEGLISKFAFGSAK